MAKEKTIINDLVMVSLHVEYDTGYRSSREMQEIIHNSSQTNKTSMRTGVMVFEKTLTSAFTSSISTLRSHYLENSLPWEKGNWRIVPVTAWQEFKDTLEMLITECKDAFNECFDKNYPKLKTEFQNNIGSLNVEFPEKDYIQERFNIEYKMGQAASPEDIRIQGIDTVERKKISESMKKAYEEQLQDGLQELAKRLVAAAEDIGERVSDPDQKNKKYTRSIENLRDLADTVEKLNITGDEAIKEACRTIRDDIASWAPTTVKNEPIVRDHIKDASGSVRDRLGRISLKK